MNKPMEVKAVSVGDGKYALKIILTGHFVQIRKWWEILKPFITSVGEDFTTWPTKTEAEAFASSHPNDLHLVRG